MKSLRLTIDDCCEIYCAASEDIQEKIGPDGDLLADGSVTLDGGEIASAIAALEDKIARLREGFYDDYKGECDRPGTLSGKWITHLERIRRKLQARLLTVPCAKCGTRVHGWEAIYDRGEGLEAGNVFIYCSDSCREAH